MFLKDILRSHEAADGGTSEDTQNSKADDSSDQTNQGDEKQGEGTATVTMTQVELDRLIAQRVKRAEKAVADKAAADHAKEAMTEADRLKAERDEAAATAKTAIAKADARLVQASAIEALADSGVSAARRAHALRMLDLSEVEVTDDGPDSAAVLAAVKALLKDVPELAGGGTASSGGSEFGGNTGGQQAALTDEVIAQMPRDELKRRLPEITAFYERKRGR